MTTIWTPHVLPWRKVFAIMVTQVPSHPAADVWTVTQDLQNICSQKRATKGPAWKNVIFFF